MADINYKQTAIICFFSLSVVLLGANDILRAAQKNKAPVSGKELITALKGGIFLEKGRFAEGEIEAFNKKREELKQQSPFARWMALVTKESKFENK